MLVKGWLSPASNKDISVAGALGMWESRRGFPRGVERVETWYFGFPPFPFLVISNARLLQQGRPKASIAGEVSVCR